MRVTSSSFVGTGTLWGRLNERGGATEGGGAIEGGEDGSSTVENIILIHTTSPIRRNKRTSYMYL